MSYELGISGKAIEIFETQQEAVEAATKATANDPEAEPEVIDLSTGEAAAPGADKASRDVLRGEVGF